MEKPSEWKKTKQRVQHTDLWRGDGAGMEGPSGLWVTAFDSGIIRKIAGGETVKSAATIRGCELWWCEGDERPFVAANERKRGRCDDGGGHQWHFWGWQTLRQTWYIFRRCARNMSRGRPPICKWRLTVGSVAAKVEKSAHRRRRNETGEEGKFYSCKTLVVLNRKRLGLKRIIRPITRRFKGEDYQSNLWYSSVSNRWSLAHPTWGAPIANLIIFIFVVMSCKSSSIFSLCWLSQEFCEILDSLSARQVVQLIKAPRISFIHSWFYYFQTISSSVNE